MLTLATDADALPALQQIVYIFFTNIYLEIICVLLATIWATTNNHVSTTGMSELISKDISFRVADLDINTASGPTGTNASVDHELHDIRLEQGEVGVSQTDGKSGTRYLDSYNS